MKNVLYHFTDRIAVHIRRLRGALVPNQPDGIPVFDDKRSFKLVITAAEIAITTDALAAVLNQHVFASPQAPLKNIRIRTDGELLKIEGALRQKGDIPFEMEGTVAVTSGGEIRIHANRIKALHLPVKGLMDLLGLEVADLVNTKKISGVRAEQNDVLLDPTKILPPPQIEGRVTRLRIEGDRIVQIFGDERLLAAVSEPGNYMAYRRAQLRFGKLTMSDTDLTLIDMDPKDAFDFYLDHYKDQLVAGYTRTTPSFGLRVFMRDFNKLRAAHAGGR